MIRVLLVFLLFAGLGAGTAEARRLPPVDGCARAPGFAAFRAQLRRAVARHDVRFIQRMIADDIVNSPGVYPGREGFQGWGEGSALWYHLENMFRLGCARGSDGRVWVPGFSLAATDEERAPHADGSRLVLILGPRVQVRAAPSETSRVIATLNWDVIPATPHRVGYDDWWWVPLPGGRRGYLTGSGHLRFFGDFRAIFERRRGRWRMTEFATAYTGY
jgi:hypothetical protein